MEALNAKYLEKINHTYEENYIYVLYSPKEVSEEIEQNGVGSCFHLEQITSELVERMH